MQLIVLFLGVLIAISGCSSSNNKSFGKQRKAADYKEAARLNVELGYGYLEQQQVARAKKKFVHALKLDPHSASVHNGMAYFWHAVGDEVEAEKEYKNAIRLSAGKGEIHDSYANFLCDLKRFDEAEKQFLIAANDKFYLKTSAVYENLGKCMLSADNEGKALNYLKTSVKRDPRNVHSILALAEIALKNNNYLEAKNILEQHRLLTYAQDEDAFLLAEKVYTLLQDKQSASKVAAIRLNKFGNKEYGE